jgi:MFS family permease
LQHKDQLWTKEFVSISLSNFFLFLTFYFLLVSLPVMVLQQFNSSKTEAGLVTTVFLISAIFIRPIAGYAIERWGYQRLLQISLFIFLLVSILYFFSHSLMALFITRFLHGIGFGMATTAAGGFVATIIPKTRSGEGMGYFIMSSNLAMVVGPFIALNAIQRWDLWVLFTISVGCSLLAFIMILFISFSKKGAANRVYVPFRLQNFFAVSAIPISIVGAFFAVVYSGILSFVSVYAKEIGLFAVSSFFFVVYASVLLLTRPFTGKWFDTYGPNVIIYPAIIVFSLGMLVLSKVQTAFGFLLAAALIGIGYGTIFPSLQTIAIQKIPPAKRGMATATFLSIFDIGIGVGSFIVGMIVAEVGFSSFYINSSLYILAGIFVFFFLHTRIQIKGSPSSILETSETKK